MSRSPFPIFVINLKRSSERRISISKQLSNLDLDCEYIEAVDGMQFTPYEIVEKYGEQVFYTNTYNKQRMTLGSLGCLLSHIKFYDLMIENNIPVACVLEDDAELAPRFADVLNSKTLVEVPWGVLLLGHYSMFRKSFNKGAEAAYWRKKVCRGHYIARPAEFPFTTLGYLIKLETAKKLRDFAFPIRMPADWVTGNTELVGDPLKIITPPCVITTKAYREKSTVRDDTDTEIPIELQRETPTLSLRRHLTVGLANIVLGTREQRAAAVFDDGKAPSTYSPVKWQTTSNNNNAAHTKPNIAQRKSYNPFNRYPHLESRIKHKLRTLVRHLKHILCKLMNRQLHRIQISKQIIKTRVAKQRTLWHEIRRASSPKEYFYLILRFILNMPIAFLSAFVYFMQDVNRSIYYGRTLSTVRVYVKKIGLFKYTRVI